jgi:hypothetical protein
MTIPEKDDRNTDRGPTESNPQTKGQQPDQEHPPCTKPDSELPLEIPPEPAAPRGPPALEHAGQTKTWSHPLLKSRITNVTLRK